jgi:hypothetical protein
MATTETYFEKEESADMLSRAVHAHYRCPDNFLDFHLTGQLTSEETFFRFEPNSTCFGRVCPGAGFHQANSAVSGSASATLDDGKLALPFDPTEIINNLRLERYPKNGGVSSRYLRKLYYLVRPALGVDVRKHIQRYYARNWRDSSFPRWPVDTTVENISETLLL